MADNSFDLDSDSDSQHSESILPSVVELFEPSTQGVCEFGDITLVIEDGFHPQLRLKVSSCMLANTSKVFRTLFRGSFAEAEAIRSGTREVLLSDNPAPMLALCQMLHLKPVTPGVFADGMLDFALLVDKFDCVEALRPAIDSLLGGLDFEKRVFNRREPEHAYNVIASVFILGQHKHFRSFTKTLVLCSGDLCSLPSTEFPNSVHDHLPANFITLVSGQQSTIRKELIFCITSILDRFSTDCFRRQKFTLVHELMMRLRSRELWPIWPVERCRVSLRDQLAALSSLQLPVISADCDPDKFFPGPVLTSHEVILVTEKLKDLCNGLCFDCVKLGEGHEFDHGLPFYHTDSFFYPEPWTAYTETRAFVFDQTQVSPRASGSGNGGWGPVPW